MLCCCNITTVWWHKALLCLKSWCRLPLGSCGFVSWHVFSSFCESCAHPRLWLLSFKFISDRVSRIILIGWHSGYMVNPSNILWFFLVKIAWTIGWSVGCHSHRKEDLDTSFECKHKKNKATQAVAWLIPIATLCGKSHKLTHPVACYLLLQSVPKWVSPSVTILICCPFQSEFDRVSQSHLLSVPKQICTLWLFPKKLSWSVLL